MKKALLSVFLLTLSCTDVVHYLSFDHGGQSLQIIRITVQKSYLDQDPKTLAELKGMAGFRMRSPDYFVNSAPIDTEDEAGFELRYTAKKGHLGRESAGIVPAAEPFGFSLALDPVDEAANGPDENALAWLGGLKYRILLSKKGMRPLWRVEVAGYGGRQNRVTVSEFDSFYLIEFPLTAWLFNPQETKLNFYLR